MAKTIIDTPQTTHSMHPAQPAHLATENVRGTGVATNVPAEMKSGKGVSASSDSHREAGFIVPNQNEPEPGDLEGTLNAKLITRVADELREKYNMVLQRRDSGGERSEKQSATDKREKAAWIEVARLAVARLMPLAVDSELPNDALFSGKRPASEVNAVR